MLHEVGRDKHVLPFMGGIAFAPDGQRVAFAPSAQHASADRFPDTGGFSIFDSAFRDHRQIHWKAGGLPSGGPYDCAFTPDGKTVVVPCSGRQVALFETETGALRHVGGVPVPTEGRRFALSPDGRFFAVGGLKRDVAVVDGRWSEPGAAFTATALSALWADLASPDSAKGFKAVVALGASPAQAAKIIGEHLKPVPAPDAPTVEGWVADLGSAEFATRESAEKELARLGDAVEPELRGAARSDSPERRDRANKLLKALDRQDAPERLQALRAVEVLEYTSTPEARDLLKKLSAGAAAAHSTRDAKAALARLETSGHGR